MKIDDLLTEEFQLKNELDKIKKYYSSVERNLSQEAKIQYNRFMGHLTDATKNDPSAVAEIVGQIKRSISFKY